MNSELVQRIITLTKNSEITEELVCEILKKLEIINIETFEADEYIIAFAINKVHSAIKTLINTSVLPGEIKDIFIDRVCGEVLYTKYIRDELPENLSEENLIKQMSLGDTTVSYDTSQGENKLLSLIEYLKTSGAGELLCYRKLTW